MFARITWVDGSPDRMQEGIANSRQSMAQELASQPGWLATALLADRQTGRGVSVGYWESQEALQASEAGHQARLQRAQASGARVREIERYEVVLQERRAPPQENTFVRVVDLRGSPAKLDQTIAFVRERVVPLLNGQQGFRAVLLGVNRATGRSLVSSIWDSAADREASDAALTEARRQGGQLAGAEQTTVELYEVVALLEKSPGALADNR
jgi:heme-degrading monooxygenase HmoA